MAIVEETQIGGGVAPTKTRMCCADARDEREFGRCEWSSSMDPRDTMVYVPAVVAGGSVGIVFGAIGAVLLVVALRKRRAARRPVAASGGHAA